ncbi:RNA-directed RNA polymerase [ssRNA phage SRR5466727_9]|uniref:RNA-directed RNA polymerase n=1 Tax=ssRNA phage SRR5466727_9 TaxID=2786438 RepID=A0A8S5KZU7_9VIRU|nr:RNA-directed RNA polymerase [ssRNA phage SRR5466727_9]DAD50840.1 TPA_asm: RNA-directed RNA polymerase [ssRNA phage SRR5466727_9]
MKSPIVLLSALLTDVKRLEPDVRNLNRDLKTIEARVKHEGIGFLTVAFSSYCDALDEGLAKREFTCPPGFKTGRYALPRLFSGLLCEVFDEKSGHLKEKPNLAYLKILREILRLFKKLPLQSERDELLDRKAKDSFLLCDESISQTNWNDRYVRHIGLVCNVILNQLEGVDYENQIHFRHGPGAVMEQYTANQKWYAVSERCVQEEQNTQLLARLGLDIIVPLPLFHTKGPLQKGEGHMRVEDDEEHKVEPRSLGRAPDESSVGHGKAYSDNEKTDNALWPTLSCKQSRLVSVAKNSTSRRTITVEPVLLQYVQQSLNTVLRDNIRKCRIMRNSLDLTDQSHNQKLAMDGSRTGLWATIDLSSASDLLSLELVKLIFRNKPTFLDWLVSSRSTSYTDGKNSRILRKYAGMGNATTFPVQSVTFAVIAMAAILDAVGRKPTGGKRGSVVRASRLVRVYGDDIIVPAQYSQQVVNWLEHFGLRVNKRKSFTDYKSWWEHQPCFRESCGVDAYGGVDVTPLYLRALPEKTSGEPNGRRVSLSTDPSAIASCVATSNLAWARCLYTFSATLAQSVEELLNKKLPMVPAKSSALGWHSRIDSCNPTKWDPSLQRLLYRAPVLKPTYRPDRLDGYAALFKFYHVPLLGRGPRHLERSQVRFSSRIVWRWMPAECG